MSSKLDFQAIKEDFEVYGIDIDLSEKVKIKCLNLCEKFHLTSEQLAVSWLGFAVPNGFEEVNLEHLETFEKELIRENPCAQSTSKPEPSAEYLDLSKSLSAADNQLLAAYGVSPASSNTDTSSATKTKNNASEGTPRKTGARKGLDFLQKVDELDSSLVPSLTQSPQSQSYLSRAFSGAVVISYGNTRDTSSWKADFSYSPKVNELPCGGEQPLNLYNFMFERLRDCAEVIDYSIYRLGKDISTSLQLEEVSSLNSLSNESAWYLGRIRCDSVGRLNAASVLLEGDREDSLGANVQLDLTKLKSYSLFPGQVVAVRGLGTGQNCLIAEEIITGKVLPGPELPLTLGNEGLQIRIACGPFTSIENLFYDPLMDLLQDIVANPPHFLFLVGPLLEASHPCLQDAMLSDTYDSILARCLSRVNTTMKSTRTTVYVVASQYDICCTPIYPTPPVLNGGSSLRLLPDPALLTIDGVSLGFTTVDYPMHIGREEISFSPVVNDRLARLSQHMLLQQSFYPIYPPPEGLNLNLEQADLHSRLPFTPHIIVTPSSLKSYVKKVDGCVFINPGHLSKGRAGGCHCKLYIRPGQEKEPEINVQILKI